MSFALARAWELPRTLAVTFFYSIVNSLTIIRQVVNDTSDKLFRCYSGLRAEFDIGG